MLKLFPYEPLAILERVVSEIASDKEWFKSVGAGEKLGNILFEEAIFNSMSEKDFHTKMQQLEAWVNGE